MQTMHPPEAECLSWRGHRLPPWPLNQKLSLPLFGRKLEVNFFHSLEASKGLLSTGEAVHTFPSSQKTCRAQTTTPLKKEEQDNFWSRVGMGVQLRGKR